MMDDVVQFIPKVGNDVVHDGMVLDVDSGIENGSGSRQLVRLKDGDVL